MHAPNQPGFLARRISSRLHDSESYMCTLSGGMNQPVSQPALCCQRCPCNSDGHLSSHERERKEALERPIQLNWRIHRQTDNHVSTRREGEKGT